MEKITKLTEVSPANWSGTVKAMKKHKEITNPWALSYYLKKKGAKPHYKPLPGDTSKSKKTPEKKEKYKDEDKKENMEFKSFSKFLAEKGEIIEEKKWIQKAVKHPGRCTPAPNPDCPKGSPQYNLAMRFKRGDIHRANLEKDED